MSNYLYNLNIDILHIICSKLDLNSLEILDLFVKELEMQHMYFVISLDRIDSNCSKPNDLWYSEKYTEHLHKLNASNEMCEVMTGKNTTCGSAPLNCKHYFNQWAKKIKNKEPATIILSPPVLATINGILHQTDTKLPPSVDESASPETISRVL
jgi:hypothetical protein